MTEIKMRVYALLEPGETGEWASKSVDLALILLILANVATAIAETIPAFHDRYGGGLFWFEAISIGIFTVEYLLRLWSCTATGVGPVWGRLRFMTRAMPLIDLMAILPFFLQFLGLGLDLRMARIVRIARLVRIAKLARYSSALQLLGRGFWNRKEELSMTLLLGGFALVLAATFIYYAENGSQPEVFSSIPAAFWWAITTLTTVGYGDAYPVTVMGKVFGGIFQVMGVLLLALPTGILASSFLEQMESAKAAASPRACPHCGEVIERV